MSCKLDLTVAYRYGHSTCNSGLFLFKIGSKDAYSRGIYCVGLNRLKYVFIGPAWSGFSILGNLICN
jgi:hypothetical protein